MYYIGYTTKSLESPIVFSAEKTPSKEEYSYMVKIIGPFGTRDEAYDIVRKKRRQVMANPGKAKYCRERQLSPSLFDLKSFRTIPLGKGKKGVIGCPKKHFHSGKCAVGTRLQTILHPEGSGQCPRGAGGRELAKRKHNPMTRTGLEYPEAGSQEAYEWAERMHKIKARKRRKNPEAAVSTAAIPTVSKNVVSHKKALALTKKIVRYAKQLGIHERAENPGESYHDRKFLMYMRELDKYKIGSQPYIATLAKAYEHLESAKASIREY
jgi:hypothetical protein